MILILIKQTNMRLRRSRITLLQITGQQKSNPFGIFNFRQLFPLYQYATPSESNFPATNFRSLDMKSLRDLFLHTSTRRITIAIHNNPEFDPSSKIKVHIGLK
jgi:hypothetical protein